MGSTSFLLIAAYWRPRSHFLVATSRTTCSSCALKWLVWTSSSRVTQPIFGTLPFPPLRQPACLRDLLPSSTPLVGASGGRPRPGPAGRPHPHSAIDSHTASEYTLPTRHSKREDLRLVCFVRLLVS